MGIVLIIAQGFFSCFLLLVERRRASRPRNPGTLRLPIEKIYEGGTSRARNPHIQNMLRMIGYGENLGSGFPMIMNAWKQSRWGEPLLENRIDIDEVALILPVQTEKNTIQETGEKTREKTREKIFNSIRERPNITTSELAEKLTITIKGVEWQLKNLREQGFIRRVGPDKGGHWEILKETF